MRGLHIAAHWIAALVLNGAHQSLSLQAASNVTFDCDGHVTHVPCPQLHDRNLSTCCVEPSCRIMSCDIDVTFDNALSGSSIEVTSYPPAEVLHVLTADGEAFTLDPNSTIGPTASFLLPNGVPVRCFALYTRRLCEWAISGTNYAPVQEEGKGENEGLSTTEIAVICVGVIVPIVIIVVGLVCWIRRCRQKGTSPSGVEDCDGSSSESNAAMVPLVTASEHVRSAVAAPGGNVANGTSGGSGAGQTAQLCGNMCADEDLPLSAGENCDSRGRPPSNSLHGIC